MKTLTHTLLLLAVALTPVFAAEVGERLPAFELKTAGGEPKTLDASVRRVYATTDRKGGKLVEEAMRGQTQALLDAQHAVLIAKISGAPGFVKRIIRGSLKDQPYSNWVDESGRTERTIPYKDDRVCLLELEDMRITAIRYFADADSLRQAFIETLAAPAPETDTENRDGDL